MRIYKYEFEVHDVVNVEMPEGARVLDVQEQRGQSVLWALIDPTEPPESRLFRVFGTGQPVPENPGQHIATWQSAVGVFVWHMFEPEAQ